MKSEFHLITLPQLGVNDLSAKLVKWYVDEGEYVNNGDLLCSVETTKVTMDVEAETSGYVARLIEVGEEVLVNKPIAVIGRSAKLVASEKKNIMKASTIVSRASHSGKTEATAKAMKVAKKHGIDINDIKKDGIIREKDVLAFVKASSADFKDIKLAKNRTSVAIYGASSGGLAILDTLRMGNKYEAVCFIDDYSNELIYAGLPVYSGKYLNRLVDMGVQHLACEIADGPMRLELLRKCEASGIEYINVIHPTAHISNEAKIGKGNFIKAGAIIETNSIIGDCCIIDNGVVIPHDNIIKNACHIAPGVILGSNIVIEDYCIIGIGAAVATNIKIGKGTIVGVNSSVVRDAEEMSIIEGVPGKSVGSRRL